MDVVIGRDMVMYNLANRGGYSQTVVSEVVTHGFLTIHGDTMIGEALHSMLNHSLYHLTVVDHQQ